MHECLDCGLMYLTPRPDAGEIEKYYPTDYVSYPLAIEDEKSWFRRMDRRYWLYKRCKQINKRVKSPGRILDIGCATGLFLNEMKQTGWEAFGIEISKYAANYAKERFNIPIYIGDLNQAGYQSAFFDVVTMWDVLEHVSDPINVLSEIARIIKPGGLLLLSLPNLASWERRLFGKYWAGWDIPRHFHLFPGQTLNRYLSGQGFQMQEVISNRVHHMSLVNNVEFWLTDCEKPDFVIKAVRKFIRSFFVRLISFPFYIYADFRKKGSYNLIISRRA